MVKQTRSRRRARYLRATPAAVLGAALACLPDPTGTLSYASPAHLAPPMATDPAVPAPALALSIPDGSTDPGGATVPAVVLPALRPVALPGAALAAYQRAAQVIDTADPGCHLDWTLLAGVGAVESAHGRHTRSGRPLLGPLLDGSHGTTPVADTDHGTIDGNQHWDRAVGPLQFLPSTWRLVRVDADADGRRDPQDLDDAALGAAVYLCGAVDDLGTEVGRSAAVYRFQHSRHYVRLVLATAAAYADQAATAARTVAVRPVVLPVVLTVLPPVPTGPPAPAPLHHPAHPPTHQPTPTPTPAATHPPPGPTPHPSDGMVDPDAPALPAPRPSTCPAPVVPPDPAVPVAPTPPPDPALTPPVEPACAPVPDPLPTPVPVPADPSAAPAPAIR